MDESYGSLMVITGAGISTESGIPDYRSADVGLYARNGYRPINYSEFLSKHSARRRYWARSYINWSNIINVKPNIGHQVLANWESVGMIRNGIVTQNVDRLHHKAGSRSVIELHGNLFTVKCLKCDRRIFRIEFQHLLFEMNRNLLSDIDRSNYTTDNKLIRPDGDIDIDGRLVEQFQIPYCDTCPDQNGILKPDVTFFGDNVPLNLVNRIYDLVEHSNSILVLGSSLQVYSSYRFVLHAHKCDKSILIANIGSTRADSLSNVERLNVKIGDILPQIKI